jgi:ABC-type transporter Mla subunit MlaD
MNHKSKQPQPGESPRRSGKRQAAIRDTFASPRVTDSVIAKAVGRTRETVNRALNGTRPSGKLLSTIRVEVVKLIGLKGYRISEKLRRKIFGGRK